MAKKMKFTISLFKTNNFEEVFRADKDRLHKIRDALANQNDYSDDICEIKVTDTPQTLSYMEKTTSRLDTTNYWECQLQTNQHIFIRGIYLIKCGDYIVCYVIGNGRHIFDNNHLVDNFGKITTLNMIDPDKIKDIDKLDTLKNRQQQKNRVIIPTNLVNLYFNSDTDLIKSLAGQVTDCIKRNDLFHDVISVKGSDSLQFNSSVEKEKLACVAEQLIDLYESDNYKRNATLKSIANINKVKTTSIIESLRDKLYDALCHNVNEVSFIDPRPFEEMEQFNTLTLGRKTYATFDELNELDFSKYNINYWFKKRISFVLEDGSKRSKVLSLRRCFYFETIFQDKDYFYYDSSWYNVSNVFIEEMKNYVKSHKLEISPLSPFTNADKDEKGQCQESRYNERMCNENHWTNFDRALSQQLELCDIYDDDGKIFYHIKRKNSSSALSHLFNQGLVSEQFAIDKTDTRFNDKFTKMTGKTSDEIPNTDERKIYYGIIANHTELPIFSLIALYNVIKFELPHFLKA